MFKKRNKILTTGIVLNTLFVLITVSFVITSMICQTFYEIGIDIISFPIPELTNFTQTQEVLNIVIRYAGSITIIFFIALLSIIYAVLLCIGYIKNNDDLILAGLVFQTIFTLFALISWFNILLLIMLITLLGINIYGYIKNKKQLKI